MDGQYGHRAQTASVATNAKLSTAIKIAGANKVAFEIPSNGTNLITATANIYAQGCRTSDGTFRRIKDMGVYSAASGLYDWEVPSNTGGFFVNCPPAVGYNYVKIEYSNTATDGITDTKVHTFY